jgi:hypothetical protein
MDGHKVGNEVKEADIKGANWVRRLILDPQGMLLKRPSGFQMG